MELREAWNAKHGNKIIRNDGWTQQAKKAAVLAAGIMVGCIGISSSANAANGFTNIATCTNCQTTADFNSAAASQALALASPGTYVVVSSNFASTSYVSVTGTLRLSGSGFGGGSHLVLTNIATTPVDATGASIASLSEADQESLYHTIDMSLFGTNRKQPFKGVHEPTQYASSFIGYDESEVVPGIGAALILMGINQNAFSPGDMITVTFDDGTSAEFVKNASTATYQWSWTGKAWDKNGNPIDRSGNLVANPNTSGNGGGSFAGSGNGGGLAFGFALAGFGACFTDTTVTIDGVQVAYEAHYVPC
jgi:hypothetical protein